MKHKKGKKSFFQEQDAFNDDKNLTSRTSNLSKYRFNILLILFALIISFIEPTKAQSSTQYQAVPTFQLIQDLAFDMGPTDKTGSKREGFELNFWALPYFVQAKTQPIVTVCGFIDINFGFSAASNQIGFGLSVRPNFTDFKNLPTLSNQYWVNVNLRVLYGNYTLLNAKQGNNWYEINPSLKVLNLSSNSTYYQENTSLVIRSTSPTIGAYVGEFRVFRINQTDSWGQFLRHYENPFNNLWGQRTISNTFIRLGIFNIMPTSQTSYDVQSYSLQVMNVLRCNQTMAMQSATDTQCTMSCLTSKCLFCQTVDKQYFNICRFCDGVSSSCQPISRCPTGYYLEYGICYSCPIGTISCSRADLALQCQSGLVLNQVKNMTTSINALGITEYNVIVTSATCDCPIGQFGTNDFGLNQVNCSKCDETCHTCAGTNVQCTSCVAPLFLMDIDGGMCVTSCPALITNYFGDPTDRKCKACASNCNACTSFTGCTNCSTFDDIVPIQVQQNDTNGVGMVDSNGMPIMVMKNITVVKNLLNAQGTCVKACPTNSIDNSTYGTCAMCPKECLTCSGISSNCTTCNVTLGSLFTVVNTSVTPNVVTSSCLPQCPTGYYSDANVCKKCDSSCTVCQQSNFCTNCTMDWVNGLLYYFVNYQCKINCPERYYPDISDSSFYFCRKCPSDCQNCVSAKKCTICLPGFYLTKINGYQLCVSADNCADGSYPNDATGTCDPCIANCKQCTGNVGGCNECLDGYFLNVNTCINMCPVGKFAQANGTCASCIANCNQCQDTLRCKTCANNYVLLENTTSCLAGTTCPTGYYLNQLNNCSLCKPECYSCSSLVTCTSCILGYSLNGTTCQNNCGNGIREALEECDDGNALSGDGCAPDCSIETGFVCQQGVLGALPNWAPDKCRCDPSLNVAQWKDYWGSISIVFDSQIYYNNMYTKQSAIPMTFCQQILQPSTISTLGSQYGCYLKSTTLQSELIIEVGPDATIGNKNANYTTNVNLIEGTMMVAGCWATGIPINYFIMNLPLDTPQVLFSFVKGANQVSQCSNDVSINLATSKGFTKRNAVVVWTLLNIAPQADNMKENIQLNLDVTYSGHNFYYIPAAFNEPLQGYTLTLQAQVTNFLGIASKNSTQIVYLKKKVIEIIDLPDTIMFFPRQSNRLYPRFRLSYCSGDSQSNLAADYAKIQYSCSMYDVALTSKVWPLINCTIPANNMTFTTQYIVQVYATLRGDTSQDATKLVLVQPSSPPSQVALIQGCNRVFSPNNSFSLTAIYNTNPNTTTFVWTCTDKATGSVCFSTNYQYITLGNSATITVAKDIFFFNMSYEFSVTTFDSDSYTNSSISCMMYASGAKDLILDVIIEGEATNTGFIDFSREQTAFKAFITNMAQVKNMTNLKYNWTISDSSGAIMKPSQLIIYQNSIGVSTSLLNRNSLYSVFVYVTDGVSWGNATQILQTKPDVSNEFTVFPSDQSPLPLTTLYSLTVTSQKTFNSLDMYVFGYINPKDGISKIPMTQKTYKKFVQFILPDPLTNGGSTSQLTCYVDVILPNRVSMTYYQTVTLGYAAYTVTQLMSDVNVAIMDDIMESMQMKHKLVSLSSSLTVSQKSTVIKKILAGLVAETTPLSDYYIQTSVASLLEYISVTTDSLMSDAQIVNTAAGLFQQMTITENVNLAQGQALQFGRTATQSLYNFANNLFSKDFTSLIGGQQQLAMKVMFMQGLKNVLKGSLSNMILGDKGGFSYQGQNIYAKAVKFDTLETQYKVNATLPKSISGQMVQNFVNITLPPPTNNSNPCTNYTACQVSVIILDNPITAFISNSKEPALKSMLVDMTISSTEVSSPFSFIQIQDLAVKNLKTPIQMTIPLNSALNFSNPNNTLGCGYIDPADQIFKQTGVGVNIITNQLVTCLPTHLTSIAVEQYAEDKVSANSTSSDNTTASQSSQSAADEIIQVNMWDSWAIYVAFMLPAVLLIGMFIGKRRDAADELNIVRIRKKQKKIYVNLYLEPIAEIKTQKEHEEEVVNYNLVNNESIGLKQQPPPIQQQTNNLFFQEGGASSPVKGNVDEFKALVDPKPSPAQIPMPEQPQNIGVSLLDENRSSASRSVKKKLKKKKKKRVGAPQDGEVKVDPLAQELFFEGGDDDDFFAIAEAEESAKSKGKKKKKKGGPRPSENNEFLPPITNRGRTLINAEILPTEEAKSQRSRSKSGKKKPLNKSKSKGKESSNRLENSNFGGFKINADEDAISQGTKKSKQASSKRPKSKSKTKRIKSKSRKEIDDAELLVNPDLEAEMISPGKKSPKKSKKPKQNDLFKPVEPEENHRTGGDAVEVINTEMNEQMQRSETQQKGFETLMNEELEKTKKELGKKKKNQAASKKKKEEKKKRDYFDKESATCVQFCIWNCKEAHRCSSLIKYYNVYLSRPSRWILLIMSWFMFIMITGYLVEGNSFIAPKSVKTEQFACGVVAAFIARIWVLFVTAFLMHSKKEKIFAEENDAREAKRAVCCNTFRYYFGLILVLITVIVSYIEIFNFSSNFAGPIVNYWAWCFLFSILADFAIVDGAFIALATMHTMGVGAAPDACGRCRNTLLLLVPQAIKDASE